MPSTTSGLVSLIARTVAWPAVSREMVAAPAGGAGSPFIAIAWAAADGAITLQATAAKRSVREKRRGIGLRESQGGSRRRNIALAAYAARPQVRAVLVRSRSVNVHTVPPRLIAALADHYRL